MASDPGLSDEHFLLLSGRQLIPAALVLKSKERHELFSGTSDEDMIVRCGEFVNFLNEIMRNRPYKSKSTMWSVIAKWFHEWGLPADSATIKKEGWALKGICSFIINKSRHMKTGERTDPCVVQLCKAYQAYCAQNPLLQPLAKAKAAAKKSPKAMKAKAKAADTSPKVTMKSNSPGCVFGSNS